MCLATRFELRLSDAAAAFAIGGLVGLLWWSLYTPLAHHLLILVVSHALLALGLERTLFVLGGGWRRRFVLVLSLLCGFVVAPAWLSPVSEALRLGKLANLLLQGAGMLVGAGVGASFGLWLERPERRTWPGAVLIIAGASLLGGSAFAVQSRLAVASQPRALTAVDAFPQQKVVVLGIDGADWRVLEPLIRAGETPHLASLVAEGRRGVLESIQPSLSPVVWTTIFSGTLPETHGLSDWYTSDARNRRVPMLWDIFAAHGRHTTTVNVPGSWPPAEVPGGVMLAGFPIPGLSTLTIGQMLGHFVSTSRNENRPVPTAYATRRSDGRFSIELPFAVPEIEPRLEGLSHALIDNLTTAGVLPLARQSLALSAELRSDGRLLIDGDALREPVTVVRDAWSNWMYVEQKGIEAVMRAHLVAADHDTLHLYLTPAFPAPWAPRYRIATGINEVDFFRGLKDPYVVESLGWQAVRDDRVAPLVPDAMLMVEETHTRATERLLSMQATDLLSHVITITDRIQHPFWALHEPAPYGERVEPPPGMHGRDPVRDAYREADAIVGRILAHVPDDALVLVVSDHGAEAQVAAGEGGHRLEGIWIARGPMVPVSAQTLRMSVIDVVPTLLHCIGAPSARDFSGVVRRDLCPAVQATPAVATYRTSDSPFRDTAVEIDRSREDQLRSLGYLE